MNIEKEFYRRMEEKFGECASVAFHLAEIGGMRQCDMERYLIKVEFQEMISAKTLKSKRATYTYLSERFFKSYQTIRNIVD